MDQGRHGDELGRLAFEASIVLDPRLAEVWQALFAAAEQTEDDDRRVPLETVGALLRLAYVLGYADAAVEPVPGDLYSELGLRRSSLARAGTAGVKEPKERGRPSRRERGRRGNSDM